MNTILLYGGGIDSSTLLSHLAGQRNILLASDQPAKLYSMFVTYGQKAEQFELEACRYFCDRYDVPLIVVPAPISQLAESAILSSSSDLANDPSINIVDGRNFTFIALAGMLAAKLGVDKIAMGYHIEPVARPFPDASMEFVHAINRMIPQAYVHKFKVVAPFENMERFDIFKYAESMDAAILQKAHTCYENVEGGCGVCTHCTTKAAILKEIACAE